MNPYTAVTPTEDSHWTDDFIEYKDGEFHVMTQDGEFDTSFDMHYQAVSYLQNKADNEFSP